MDPIFILTVFIVWLGLLSYSCAALYALAANSDECTRILRREAYRAERSFRLTGRSAFTAAEVRAWRMSLPLPTVEVRRVHYLRSAPAAHEAVTVPNATIPAEYV